MSNSNAILRSHLNTQLTAWEAVRRLLAKVPAPPPVYQGQYDLKRVWAVTKAFLGLTTI
jgi:hypothetical protein